MSQINVDKVLPQSALLVEVNGALIGASSSVLKIGENSAALSASNSLIMGMSSGNLVQPSTTNNTIIGYNTGASLSTGSSNTLVGVQAGQSLTSGGLNTFVGSNTSNLSTTGSSNTCVGNNAGDGLTTGNGNTFIGSSAGGSTNVTGNGNVCIGQSALPSTSGVSYEFTLGGPFISTLRCAQTSITSLSDERDKKDIKDLSTGLNFIESLRPVEFVWDDRDENGRHDIADFGFIAQDLKKAQEDINKADVLKLVYESNPEKLEASYGKLVPILVKAIQEMSSEIKSLKEEVLTLKSK